MLTPRFKVEQTKNTIVLTILAPYTNIKKTEIHVLDEDVRFYSAPYYLRLTLPGKVDEGANSSAKYEVESHSFLITLDKVVPGETFPNLDMLTSMLQPKVETPSTSKSNIEVLSSTGEEINESVDIGSHEWFVPQKLDDGLSSEQLLQQFKYGFASRHSGLGNKYEVELAEVAEITNPDTVSPENRVLLQEATEDDRFNEDHYFQDLMVTDLSSILAYKLKISKFKELTDSDRDQLKNLTNQEFLLDKTENIHLFLGVVDIVFAYMYDVRVNEGKSCVESPWNVSRLSATFSFFRIFEKMDDVVRSCIRRSLSYPLNRNWDLTLQVFKDTHAIIAAGNVAILKCLLKVRKLFMSRDPFYIQNQLYVDEYCVWVQQASAENWQSLGSGLQNALFNLNKDNIGFDLILLEVAANITLEEEMEEDMSQQVSEMSI